VSRRSRPAGRLQIDSTLRTTFRISTTEGVFSQIFATLAAPGSVFITRLAILLGAGPVHFGLLSAAGQISLLFQPLGVAITHRKSFRKKTVILLAAAGRILAPLFGVIPFLFTGGSSLGIFLALYMFSAVFLALSANIWIGWINDTVPRRLRGRFFASRNRVLMVAGLVVGYIFGALVDLFSEDRGWLGDRLARLLDVDPQPSALKYALLAVFLMAGILGIIGLSILRRQPEMEKPHETEGVTSIFLSALRDRNFRMLLIFGFWWMVAIGIGAPFWQPFMMTVLRMDLVDIFMYATVSTAGALLAVRFWGKLIDRAGNRAAMGIAIVLGTINPLFWVVADESTLWLIYIEAFMSGIMWSCAGIVMTNFVLAVAPPGRAQVYSGIFSAVSGVGVIITMLASGFFMPGPMVLFGRHLHPEQVLFLCTALARLTAEIPLAFVREPSVQRWPRTVVVAAQLFQQVTAAPYFAVRGLLGGRRRGQRD
jgi:MFS family permease